jgi:hypothetical protein
MTLGQYVNMALGQYNINTLVKTLGPQDIRHSRNIIAHTKQLLKEKRTFPWRQTGIPQHRCTNPLSLASQQQHRRRQAKIVSWLLERQQLSWQHGTGHLIFAAVVDGMHSNVLEGKIDGCPPTLVARVHNALPTKLKQQPKRRRVAVDHRQVKQRESPKVDTVGEKRRLLLPPTCTDAGADASVGAAGAVCGEQNVRNLAVMTEHHSFVE